MLLKCYATCFNLFQICLMPFLQAVAPAKKLGPWAPAEAAPASAGALLEPRGRWGTIWVYFCSNDMPEVCWN